MKKTKKTKKKEPLLKLVIFVIVIAVIIIVALPIVNNKVSSLIDDTIKNQIAAEGLSENVTYESIKIDSANGRVTAKNLSIADKYIKGKITIDEAVITVPVQEIMALVISPDKGVIRDVDLAVSGINMDFNLEGVDVLLGLSDVKVSVNGKIDANFVNNLSSGNIGSAISQIDKVKVNLGKTQLTSSLVAVDLNSLVARLETIENEKGETVREFDISMDAVNMNSDSNNSSAIFIENYETQVQGTAVNELITNLIEGKVEIDLSKIDSMNVNLNNLKGETPSIDVVNLKSLGASLNTVTNENDERAVDLEVSMTDATLDGDFEGDNLFFKIGSYDSKVQGENVIEIVNTMISGKSKVDMVDLDLISMDFKDGRFIISNGDSFNKWSITLAPLTSNTVPTQNTSYENIVDFQGLMANSQSKDELTARKTSLNPRSFSPLVEGINTSNLLEMIAEQESKINLDSISLDIKDGEFYFKDNSSSDKVNITIVSLVSNMNTIKNEDNENISDFNISMTDAAVDANIAGFSVLFDIASYDTKVRGKSVLDIIKEVETGELELDSIDLDLVTMATNDLRFNFKDTISGDKVNISLGALASKMNTTKTEDNENISDFNISMTDAAVDANIAGFSVLFDIASYDTKVRGKSVLDIIKEVETGELELDSIDLDLVTMATNDLRFNFKDTISGDKVNISLGALVSKVNTTKNEDNENIRDFNISITDAVVDTEIEKEEVLFGVEHCDTKLQGQVVIDLLDSPITGNMVTDKLLLESINMGVERASLIVPDLSTSIGSLAVNLDGLESVNLISENITNIDSKVLMQLKLNDLFFKLDEQVLDAMLFGPEMIVGPLLFVRDPQNWNLDNLEMTLAVENWKANLSDVVLNTSWLDISGSSNIEFSKEFEVLPSSSAVIRVDKFPEELRPILGLMTFILFQTELPLSDAFTAQITNQSIVWKDI